MQFYFRLRSYPFIRILIPFCLGILTGYYCNLLSDLALLITAISIIPSIFIVRLIYSNTAKGLLLSILLFTCGLLVIQCNLKMPYITTTEKVDVCGQIVSTPIKKDKYTKFIVRWDNKKYNSPKLIVYIFKREKLKFSKGDLIHFKARLKKIENRKEQLFDYKHYMKRQYIQYAAFVSYNDFKKVENNKFSLTKFCSDIRIFIIKTFRDSGIKEPELGLLNAMLLGEKTNIDMDIKKNYVAAGGVHFLAISGLHTGIVFILITFSLHNICRIPKSSITFLIMTLAMLWIYAIITGLAPSVLRASIILSLIIIGKHIKREVNLYNAIASAAFIILVFDPGALFSPGFQLSFAAYTSIIYLYPKFHKLITCKNKLINNLWKLTSVSLAAQIGTLPLCIYYFHHIYYYSLLTNLCISGLIPIVIYGGFLSFIVSLLITGDTIISESLVFIIKVTNSIIDTIAHFPGAISVNINYSIVEIILTYSIIISSLIMIVYKKKNFIFIILISTLLYCSYNSYKIIANDIRIEEISSHH